MEQILEGVWHWTAPHPNLGGVRVSSYWLEDDGVLIDPLIPEEGGLEWFAERSVEPAAIVLSNRHHYRDSGAFHERFGCAVQVPRAGLREFGGERPATGYEGGDSLPGGLVAIEVGALSPDDSALHRESSRALWLADTVVRGGGADDPIGWVIDQLMDDPPETKRRLLTAFRRLLDELDFEHLLLAHGAPLLSDGRAELERMVDAGGRTASEAFAGL